MPVWAVHSTPQFIIIIIIIIKNPLYFHQSGLSRYQELDSESGLIGFLSLRSIQNHCAEEKFFVSDFC